MGSKYYVNPDTGQRVYIKDKIPSLAQYRKAADQDEIDEEIRQDLVNKLDAPSSPLVGEYLKISAVNADGSVVLENVDLPIATFSDYGLAKFSSGGFVFGSEGRVYLATPTSSHITSRKALRAVMLNKLDDCVKAAMCDGIGADWEPSEQLAARQRIGIDKGYELISEITDWDPNILKKLIFQNDYISLRMYFTTEAHTGDVTLPVRIGYDDLSNCPYLSVSQAFATTKRFFEVGADINNGIIDAYCTAGGGDWQNRIMYRGYQPSTKLPLFGDKLNFILISAVSGVPTEGNTIKIYGIRK